MLTTNWKLNLPVEGVMDWEILLNQNFDSIDTIMQSLRNHSSSCLDSDGPLDAPVGDLWYSTLENPGLGLYIKHTTGYSKLLDQVLADTRYLKKTGDVINATLTFSQNGILYFLNSITSCYSKIYFQTYIDKQDLTLEFGPFSSSCIRFKSYVNGVAKEPFMIGRDVNTSIVPIEIPSATQASHAINKGQSDSTYATISALNSALARISALEALLTP